MIEFPSLRTVQPKPTQLIKAVDSGRSIKRRLPRLSVSDTVGGGIERGLKGEEVSERNKEKEEDKDYL